MFTSVNLFNVGKTFLFLFAELLTLFMKDTLRLLSSVILYLLLEATIGSFIYGFIPTNLLTKLAGSNNMLAVPIAALAGIPMYIRAETMIPIANLLVTRGVSYGVIIALVVVGAGCSLPEITLLSAIFKKS